jgi:hypothetical protein
MDDARNVIADNVRAILVVIGVGLLMLGGVGPGPIGTGSVLGIVTLLAAVILVSPIAELLRTDEETENEDPLDALRDQYIPGISTKRSSSDGWNGCWTIPTTTASGLIRMAIASLFRPQSVTPKRNDTPFSCEVPVRHLNVDA